MNYEKLYQEAEHRETRWSKGHPPIRGTNGFGHKCQRHHFVVVRKSPQRNYFYLAQDVHECGIFQRFHPSGKLHLRCSTCGLKKVIRVRSNTYRHYLLKAEWNGHRNEEVPSYYW